MKHIRKTAVIAAIVLLAVVLCLPIAARDESDAVQLHACDKSFGGLIADDDDCMEGSASVKGTLQGTAVVYSTTFDEIDISECDTIAFELYIDDINKAQHIKNVFFEVSSSGTCDKEELQWEFSGQFGEGKIDEGWNTVYLDIGAATDCGINLTEVDYIRFYTSHAAGANGMEFRLDDIRACVTGGEDFSDMVLDAYQGDNSDAEVRIKGQSAPDPDRREEGMTQTWGVKK